MICAVLTRVCKACFFSLTLGDCHKQKLLKLLELPCCHSFACKITLAFIGLQQLWKATTIQSTTYSQTYFFFFFLLVLLMFEPLLYLLFGGILSVLIPFVQVLTPLFLLFCLYPSTLQMTQITETQNDFKKKHTHTHNSFSSSQNMCQQFSLELFLQE